MVDDNSPCPELYDEAVARDLLGCSLLVGIMEEDGTGAVRRWQLFGTVTVADRRRGICIETADGTDFWLPPATHGITPAEPGEYRNTTTGEVVVDPDFTASWVISRPMTRN